MKKILYTFLFSFTLISCMGNLGNEDYRDINKLNITFEKFVYEYAMGDLVEIKTLINEDFVLDQDRYDIIWTISDEEIEDLRNKLDFKWTADKVITDNDVVICIIDKKEEVNYYGKFSLTVKGNYEFSDSWLILSENAGKSQLSFLSVQEFVDSESENYPEGSSQYYYERAMFIPNAYTSDLGSGPIAMQEHFREANRDADEWYVEDPGNIAIFQESGSIDINGKSFEKEIEFIESFQGNLPDGVTSLRPGTFMQFVDVLTDQRGQLYSRIKKFDYLYHNDKFYSEPLTALGESEALSDCIVTRGLYASNRHGLAVIYDGGNKRFLTIKDGGLDSWSEDLVGASMIEPVRLSNGLSVENTIPLDDMSGYEMLGLHIYDSDKESSSWSSFPYGYMMLLKEEATGKYWLQDFVIDEGEVTYVGKTELNGLSQTPDCIAFGVAMPNEYIFYSIGQDVYMIDLLNGNSISKYYTFEANVTAMNFLASNNTHLAVGLEDGTFVVLGACDARNARLEHRLVYKSEEKVGKIVDIQYKNNSNFNY